MPDTNEQSGQKPLTIKEYKAILDKIAKESKANKGKLNPETVKELYPMFLLKSGDTVNDSYLKNNHVKIAKQIDRIVNGYAKGYDALNTQERSAVQQAWNSEIARLQLKDGSVKSDAEKLDPRKYSGDLSLDSLINKWSNFGSSLVKASSSHIQGVFGSDRLNKNNIDMKLMSSELGSMGGTNAITAGALGAEDMMMVDAAAWAVNIDNNFIKGLAKSKPESVDLTGKDLKKIHLMPLPNEGTNINEMKAKSQAYTSGTGVYEQPAELLRDFRSGDAKLFKAMGNTGLNLSRRKDSVKNCYKRLTDAYNKGMDNEKAKPENQGFLDKHLSKNSTIGKWIDTAAPDPYILALRLAVGLWRNRDAFSKMVRSTRQRFPKMVKYIESANDQNSISMSQFSEFDKLRIKDIREIAKFFETWKLEPTNESYADAMADFLKMYLKEADEEAAPSGQSGQPANNSAENNVEDAPAGQSDQAADADGKSDANADGEQDDVDDEQISDSVVLTPDILERIDKCRVFIMLIADALMDSLVAQTSFSELTVDGTELQATVGDGDSAYGLYSMVYVPNEQPKEEKEEEKPTEENKEAKEGDAGNAIPEDKANAVKEYLDKYLKSELETDYVSLDENGKNKAKQLVKRRFPDLPEFDLDSLYKDDGNVKHESMSFRTLYKLRMLAEADNEAQQTQQTGTQAANGANTQTANNQAEQKPKEGGKLHFVAADKIDEALEGANSQGFEAFKEILSEALTLWSKIGEKVGLEMDANGGDATSIEYGDTSVVGSISTENLAAFTKWCKDAKIEEAAKFADSLSRELKQLSVDSITIHNFNFAAGLANGIKRVTLPDLTNTELEVADITSKTVPNIFGMKPDNNQIKTVVDSHKSAVEEQTKTEEKPGETVDNPEQTDSGNSDVNKPEEKKPENNDSGDNKPEADKPGETKNGEPQPAESSGESEEKTA